MNVNKNKELADKQQLLLEIVTGLKEKFFQPLINENRRLASAVNKQRENDEKVLAELMERVDRLEKKVEESPVTVLSAIRDAINKTNGGVENGSN